MIVPQITTGRGPRRPPSTAELAEVALWRREVAEMQTRIEEAEEFFAPEQPRDCAEYLARNGGMMSTGQGLGVYVGRCPAACPPGWVFLWLGEATTLQVRDALAQVKKGRNEWPQKA